VLFQFYGHNFLLNQIWSVSLVALCVVTVGIDFIAPGLTSNSAAGLPSALSPILETTNLQVRTPFQYFAVNGLSDEESTSAGGLLLFTNGALQMLSSQ